MARGARRKARLCCVASALVALTASCSSPAPSRSQSSRPSASSLLPLKGATSSGGTNLNWTSYPFATPVGMRYVLLGAACPAADDCWAVGEQTPTSDAYGHTLVLHLSDGAWALLASPVVTTRDALLSVECLKPDDCWAVGQSTSDALAKLLALHFDGKSWSVVTVPSPADRFQDDGEPWLNTLDSVACLRADLCFAAGSRAIPGTPRMITFVERWDGSAWSQLAVPGLPSTPMPQPGTVNSSPFPGLEVQCLPLRSCILLGAISHPTTSPAAGWPQRTILYHLRGNSWVPSPLPQVIYRVSCASPTRCWGLGVQVTTAGTAETIASRFDGRAWTTPVVVPASGGAGTDTIPATLTCPSFSDCWAFDLSYVARANGVRQGSSQGLPSPSRKTWLVLHESGGQWSTSAAFQSSPARVMNLLALACATEHLCFAAGEAYAVSPAGVPGPFQAAILEGSS